MAFEISRGESSFSETEKKSLEKLEGKDSATVSGISCQIQLKSSLSSKDPSSQSLSRKDVLQRIRHRKMLNRIRNAFEGGLGSSQSNTVPAQEQMWLQQDDTFSAP